MTPKTPVYWRTVYVHWWHDGLLSGESKPRVKTENFKAIKKITITEGEFDND